MRVAVTGATGFIGQHLVRELLARGDRLLLLGRDLEKLRTMFGTDNGDVSLVGTEYGRDLSLRLKNVDAIVHMSGLRWWKDKIIGDYLVQNVIPTENLYSAAMSQQVNNIVFASSIAVYNSQVNALPFSENEDCRPRTHYGVSKLVCEKIGGYYNSEFGMKIKSLRIGQVVGLGERGGFMLSNFMEKAMSRQSLTLFGEGVGVRDYVYVLDVVAAISQALDHATTAGVYNVSLGKPVTHLQVAEAINRAFDNSGNITIDSEKAEDKSRQWMSCERAERELGWHPRWDLDDMFADLASKLVNQGLS